MRVAVLDPRVGSLDDLAQAAQQRDESVEVAQGIGQQCHPVADDLCGLHQAASAVAPGRRQEDPMLQNCGDQPR